jgi:putative ABC transport system permease protein
MQIPLLQGRMLADTDTADRPTVVLISQELARKQFANVNPIGQQIMCGYDVSNWYTIVGVVGSVRQDSPASDLAQTFYVPVAQHLSRVSDMEFVVRTHNDPAVLAGSIQELMRHDFPLVAVNATTMREAEGESSRGQTFRMMLFTCFAGVSILLAAVGMYGVTAYTVTQRRFEFALRFALGAQRRQILGMNLWHGMLVAAFGIVVGLGLSFGLLRVLSNLLGTLPAFDAASYSIAVLAVLTIAMLAVLVPCFGASQVEPMRVLRGD